MFAFFAFAGLPKKNHAAAVCCVRPKQPGEDTSGKNYRNPYLSFYNYGSVYFSPLPIFPKKITPPLLACLPAKAGCVRAKQPGKDTSGKNYRNPYLSFYNYDSLHG